MTGAQIGNDIFTSGVSEVLFGPSVSVGFPKRTWGMHESGIVNWWHRLLDPLQGRVGTMQDNAPVMAVKISGNVLIIFAVWSMGLLLASMQILCEVVNTHGLRAVANFWSYFTSIVTTKVARAIIRWLRPLKSNRYIK